MKTTTAAILATLTLTPPALAQFAAPRKDHAVPARGGAAAPRDQTSWIAAMTRKEMTRVNFLPRTAPVATAIQREITTYAPGDDATGYAREWSEDDCERSIRAAETRYNLPPYLLAAIAITESGRNGRPNPMAMNIGGRPYFASSTRDMQETVARNGGETSSIDVGCTQINLHYHAGRFKDWRSLLVPSYNAEYAALYLRELYRQRGGWNAAVGSYHSSTPWKSANYACLVSRRWSQIFGSDRPGCGADIEAMSRLMYATQRGR